VELARGASTLSEVVAVEAPARLPTRPNKAKPPTAQMHAIRSIIDLLSEVIREPEYEIHAAPAARS
jgi:hypothetical protein